jgi:SecD/SecF fusion protein
MHSFATLFGLLGQATPAPPPLEFYQETWFRTLVAVAIISVAWGLGKWLSRVWRMPDYSFRFGVIFFSLIAGAVICLSSWPPKLGIDLKGGVILIYEVAEEQEGRLNLEEPVARVRNNLDTVNVSKQVTARGGNQIVVSADTKDAEILATIEEIVTGIPFPDFNVVAAGRELRNEGTGVVFDVSSTTAAGNVDMDDMVAALKRRINPGGQKEVVVREFGEQQVEIIIPEIDPNEINVIKDKISRSGMLEFRIVANNRDHMNEIELARANPLAKEITDQDNDPIARWVPVDPREVDKLPNFVETRKNEAGETEALVIIDEFDVTGRFLSNAAASHDERGRPSVIFNFNAEGAVRFGELTSRHTPDPATKFQRQLGIILDGQLVQAPNLESAITSSGRIVGSFTEDEVKRTVGILNAGRLPAALDKSPVSQTTISPQLGADTVYNGSIVMLVSTLAIMLFMAMYYRFSGLVANVAVLMNLLLVVAIMITLRAAFTLAGLAGLVLSVGMAVDANVLIYERMREELQRGAALRMAIRNGFGRAMSTIIDSNLTTLLTAMVLYAIGTDQLKGFAVTLFFGLLLNLFTSVYVARVIFDVAERRRWISRLNMMKMFQAPGWDFVRPTKYAITASLIVIVGGLIAAASRGEGLFGIDFTGGTSVQIVLAEGHELTVGEVREIVNRPDGEQGQLEDVTVSIVGTPNEQGKSRIYKIDTSVQSIEEVEKRLKQLFGERLQVYGMSYKELAQIPGGVEASAAISTPASESKGSAADEQGEREKSPTKSSDGQGDPVTNGQDKNESSTKARSGENSADDPGSKDGKDANRKETAGGSDEGSESKKASDDSNPQSAHLPEVERLVSLSSVYAVALFQDEEKQASTEDTTGTKAEAARDADKTSGAKDSEKKADGAKSENTDAAGAKKEDEPKADNEDPPVKQATEDAGQEKADAKLPLAEDKSSEKKDQTAAPKKPAERTMPPAERSSTQARFPGGSSAILSFSQAIGSTALLDALESAAKELKVGPARFTAEEQRDSQDSVNAKLYRGWNIQTTLPPDDARKVLDHVETELSQTPVFLAASNIGGKVAGNAQVRAIYAMLASMVMIVVYVWVRFQNIVFGLAAVVALVHDVLVAITALAVSYYVADYFGWAMVDPFKISLDVVAALLTIVGFSINDTIVIFDRIREIKGKSPEITADMVNKAVNQTLGRTVLTSGTVLVVTIILYVWGGQEIHAFAFAMLVGLISGTYSTVYIASPLVLWLRKPGLARKTVSPRGPELAMRV